MRSYALTVLKFGSSVLRSEADLPSAVHEIYRWVRAGHRVIAVVSALGNTTDALLTQAQSFGAGIGDHSVAALLATGEATSAALLSLALDRAGIPSTVLDETRLGLRTRGPVLNSEPCQIDAGEVLRALNHTSVVVAPGFVGRQDDGSISLLGRGGSDLTAVFIAQQLKAERCRLVKDVDGIFEYDPATQGVPPRRYKTLTWEEANRVGGGIVQFKAVDYAAQHHFSIEVAAVHSDLPTLIGDRPASFHDAATFPERIRVGLLGAGTVGLGVYRTLAAHPEAFEITNIAVRRLEREDGTPRDLLTQDPWKVIDSDCELVIELIGGLHPAKELIEAALRAGKNVITANKLVVSRYGEHFRRIASENGAQILYSAAVGGAVPMLEQVSQIAQTRGITTLQGVVNGTTNFILDCLAEGLSREDAVKEAQRLGFAEQDPTTDLDGSDAAHKLALLAQSAFGTWLHPSDIERTGIENFAPEAVRDAAKSGQSVRLVASLRRGPTGVKAWVGPEYLDRSHAFANTRNEENCLEIHSETGDIVHVRGKGAGRWPTTESVVADLFDLYRAEQVGTEEASCAARRIS